MDGETCISIADSACAIKLYHLCKDNYSYNNVLLLQSADSNYLI